MMKNAIQISIPKACNQNFNTFKATNLGGYCGTCEKEVIDFTKMSDMELQNYVRQNDNACGRFKKSQLKTYAPVNNNRSLTNGVLAIGVSLLALCATPIHAQDTAENTVQTEVVTMGAPTIIMSEPTQQNITVKGIVLDEANMPVPGVNVVSKGTSRGTTTDFDGNFEFSGLSKGENLVFSYIGYETKTYTVPATDKNILEIKIQFDAADVELMGEVVTLGAYTTKRNIFQKIGDIFK